MVKLEDLSLKVAKLEERVDNHIKFFWTVVAFGGLWLIAISGGLLKISNDIGKLPTALSTQLIKESEKSANAGQIKEASRSVEMAATLMKAALQGKVRPKADYFKNVSDHLESLQSSRLADQWGHPVAGAEEFMNAIEQAWTELANYRSSLQPVPPIPRNAITIISSSRGTSFPYTGSPILYDGPPGPILVFTIQAQGSTVTNMTLIAANPGAYQALDGVVWTNTTFVNVKIKDEGLAPFELHNVKFINCTFEINNDAKNGHLLAEYIALNWSTLSKPLS